MFNFFWNLLFTLSGILLYIFTPTFKTVLALFLFFYHICVGKTDISRSLGNVYERVVCKEACMYMEFKMILYDKKNYLLLSDHLQSTSAANKVYCLIVLSHRMWYGLNSLGLLEDLTVHYWHNVGQHKL